MNGILETGFCMDLFGPRTANPSVHYTSRRKARVEILYLTTINVLDEEVIGHLLCWEPLGRTAVCNDALDPRQYSWATLTYHPIL